MWLLHNQAVLEIRAKITGSLSLYLLLPKYFLLLTIIVMCTNEFFVSPEGKSTILLKTKRVNDVPSVF